MKSPYSIGSAAATFLLISIATAYAGEGQDRIDIDQQFVLAEQKALDCSYPRIFNRRQPLTYTSRELHKYFGIGREARESCEVLEKDFAELYLKVPRSEASLPGSYRYPLYMTLMKTLSELPQTRRQLEKANIKTFFQTNRNLPALGGLNIDPLKVEHYLRSRVEDSSNPGCSTWIERTLPFIENRHTKYDLLFWKRSLHEQGYACTVELYYEISSRLNQGVLDNGNTQEIFERQILDFEDVNPETLSEKIQTTKNKLSPHDVLILFPPLGFDIPSDRPREQLTVTEWKKKDFYSPSLKQRFEKVGIRFELIDRVSIEDVMLRQVVDSKNNFLEVIQKHYARDPQVRFIVLGRSMGGLIARIVLSELENEKIGNHRVHELVKGVVLMGSTPFGSVIADYKSRIDQFDSTYRDMTSLKTRVARSWLDFVSIFSGNESHFERLIEAGRVRDNVWGMSHVSYNKDLIASYAKSPYRVLNLIALKPTIKDYFRGAKRSQDVDFVFLHWSMYGPTEGSSPLSHASWDTSRSARVFLKQYNHLAFWNLSPEAGMNLIIQSLEAAQEIGIFEPIND